MRNRPYGYESYLVNVKTIGTIGRIFVAFSEKLNFSVGQPFIIKTPLENILVQDREQMLPRKTIQK